MEYNACENANISEAVKLKLCSHSVFRLDISGAAEGLHCAAV